MQDPKSSKAQSSQGQPMRFMGPSPVKSFRFSEDSNSTTSQTTEALLSPEQIARARRSPVDFAIVTSRGWYQPARHLNFLNEVLLCLAARKAPASLLRKLGRICEGADDDELLPFHKLIVEMPPRYAKSETVSHFFASWYVGTFPDHHVICTSYGQEKAADYGRAARDSLVEYGEAVFGIKVRQDSDAAHRWQVEGHRGGMYSAGVGGALTGRGAHAFIIDDALKNAQEAWSVTTQDMLANWYESVADTRLEPDAIIIDIGTRWHQKDQAGYLQESDNAHEEDEEEVEVEPWAVLSFPAIADEIDALGREPGDVLWPERYSKEAVYSRRTRMMRTAIGKYYWFAMFQQKPALPEGLLYFDKELCEAGRDQAPAPRQVIQTSELPGMPADGAVYIWERPRNAEWYYAGADTADGKGEAMGTWGATGGPDRNVCAIYRGSDDVQVAEIFGRQSEPAFAKLLFDWGTAYNNALICPENNRRAVMIALRVLGYKNLYSGDRQPNVRVRQPVQNIETRREYGFNTNTLSRGPLLSEWREALHSGEMRPRSKRLYEESLVFVQGDPPAAMPGQHDDTVFAHALAKKAKSQAGRSRAAGTGLQHIGTSF